MSATSGDGKSLYDRLGGQSAVMAAVDLFYEKVLADEVTRPFFQGLDMEAQTKKQIAFMTRAFGGPAEYAGRDLRNAHANLVRDKGLGDRHFEAVAVHLESTLRELGVSGELVAEVMMAVGTMRNEVLDR